MRGSGTPIDGDGHIATGVLDACRPHVPRAEGGALAGPSTVLMPEPDTWRSGRLCGRGGPRGCERRPRQWGQRSAVFRTKTRSQCSVEKLEIWRTGRVTRGLVGAGGQFSRIPEFQFPDGSDVIAARGGRHSISFVAHIGYGRAPGP